MQEDGKIFITEALSKDADLVEFASILRRFQEDDMDTLPVYHMLSWAKERYGWAEEFTESVLKDMVAAGTLRTYKIDVVEVHRAPDKDDRQE